MVTVTVKMLRTAKGSPNGTSVVLYNEDKKYTLPYDLAKSFISSKYAVAVVKEKEEEKQVIVPENKALKGADEDKGAVAKAKKQATGRTRRR